MEQAQIYQLKILTGFVSGAYGHKEEEGAEDVHEVQAWFTNPFTNGKVYTIICPSHQVQFYMWCYSAVTFI